MTKGTSSRMPVAFFGHGSPMNALERNAYTNEWRAFGKSIPRPTAILCVSAHWYIDGTAVTASENPQTIHDFGGFPEDLFAKNYPAPGSPQLAQRVRELLAPTSVKMDFSWGLDHGTWSVLTHVFPNADVPVVQLSIDRTKSPEFHYESGRRLSKLRDEGVLVIGSGDVVHNLRMMRGGTSAVAFDWAEQFNQLVLRLIHSKERARLIDFKSFGQIGSLAIPTPEHYLPLLHILGMQHVDDEVSVITNGIELASISMLSIALADKK